MKAVRYQKPAILSRLPRRGHAVIEASAGTGKTYTIEHLVVDLLLGGGASIGELLVVTFTEKATAELKARVRTLLEKLVVLGPDEGAGPDVPDEACWLLDGDARARLRKALLDFDTATIATIHGFCQRVLGEQAFATRRLFAETLVDGADAFSAAFRDVLRSELAREPGFRSLLAAYLADRSVEDLEELLYTCSRERGRLLPRYDPTAIDRALAEFPAGALAALEAEAKGRDRTTLKNRWNKVAEPVAAALASSDPVARLRAVGELIQRKSGASALSNLRETVAMVGGPAAPGADAALAALERAAVPLAAAAVQWFLPPVVARLSARKREAGLLDFDDMLVLLRDALHGPGGEELARLLRGRYRYALVDEFQDTDEVQWEIFRRVFFECPDTSLFLIGDPKQAIYGFRGADVHAYLKARRAVEEAGGVVVPIDQNFRSTAAMIEAYNRILDQAADAPFFTGEIRYDHPVTCGKDALRLLGPDGTAAPPVRLFELRPSRAGASKAVLLPPLAAGIAGEIRALLDPAAGLRFDEGKGEAPRPLFARDVFVLTRSIDEGREIGAVLREAGIPHAFFKQDGLFQTDEAGHLLDVLAALAAPDDRSARIRAWLTPLFGLRLEELPAARDLGADHPLVATLDGWRALGERRDYEALFAAILDGSGLVRRTLLAGDERALTNYGHLVELLLEEVARRGPTLDELAATLRSWVEERALPPGESGNVQRLESERDAVQIMTLHKSKGLEAPVVFLAGGFKSPSWSRLTVFHDEGGRAAWIGSPPEGPGAIADRESAEEDQRLLYVGLTRAKARLYLPYVPFEAEDGGEGPGREVDGCYAAVNRRLEDLVRAGDLAGTAGPLFERVVVRDAAVEAEDEAAVAGKLVGFAPRPELLAEVRDDSFAKLRRERGGLVITSYSRLAGRAHLPVRGDETAELDRDEEAPAAPPPDDLPGGTGTGNFLHEVLEAVSLDTVRGIDAEAWATLPSIDRLLRRTARRHELDERHLPRAARVVHAALVTPLGPDLPSVIGAREVSRELEFLYPIPEAAHPLLSRSDGSPGPLAVHRGFVKGFIDLVFEHDGRVYFADWKSDFLPSYGADALAAHVRDRYDVQARLYSLAIVKYLGLRTEADFEARFGGLLYLFLRGLAAGAGGGRFFARPSFATVAAWEADLLARRDLGEGGAR